MTLNLQPMTPENCAEIFDRHFTALFNEDNVNREIFRDAIKVSQQRGGKPSTALDLGAGHGRHAAALLDLGLDRVTCVEVSRSALRALTELSHRRPGIEPRAESFFDLTIDARYDIAGIYGMTFTMFPAEQQSSILETLIRALHPGWGVGIVEWTTLDRSRAFIDQYPLMERPLGSGVFLTHAQRLINDVWVSNYGMSDEPDNSYEELTYPAATEESFRDAVHEAGGRILSTVPHPRGPRLVSLIAGDSRD